MTDALINVNGSTVNSLDILLLMTVLTLLPSMVVMMTSFTRYVVSFSFLRTAMGTQQTPPNVVLVGIALFLTLITMDPVIGKIQTEAWEPYRDQEIGGEEFIERSADALKEYMLHDTQLNTLRMYCDLAHVEVPEDDAGLREEAMDLSLRVIVPAFMTQELQRAFYTGLLLYIPFLLIDIVVSSTLMSMGMIMLPPAMISTPFKLLLFVSINGWNLMFSSLVQGVK